MLSFQGGIRVAAKSGLLGLTRAMANELAPLGEASPIPVGSAWRTASGTTNFVSLSQSVPFGTDCPSEDG